MGRHEQPVAPGVLNDFATALRALRAAAGSPAYREMSRRAQYSSSALSAAASGQSLPTLELTLAYVRACGGEEREWRERWQTAAAAAKPPRPDAPPPAPASAPDRGGDAREPGPARRRQRTGRTLVKIGAGPLIIALVLVLVLIFNEKPAAINITSHGRTAPANTAPAGTPTAGSASPAPAASSATAPEPGGAGTLYDRTEGPGCVGQSEGAVFEDQPIPTHLWTRTTGADWPGGNCPDTVLASEPTTNLNPDVWQNDYGWTFRDVPTNAACTYAIYIADTPDSQYTAGYFWTTGDGQETDQNAFTVDQGAHRGAWVAHGPFTFPTGTATLELTDAGDGGPNAPMTASLARLTCTA